MREIAPYLFWVASTIGGLIAFGAIEAHLVIKHGYLFAFTVGIFESGIGAMLVGMLIYAVCFVIFLVCDGVAELRNRIHRPKTGD
jgi:hypothetical protein